ncbi:uncharacterized protein LOC120461372 [Pimephales promelas]|uniref:uncharacterized protein LOC120461372 n=1 Tax=Pimephales promelas TaxID=90988 RepID=UPI001955697E|nr:uncharacterized protein LOC120461372 [Pimephales promelas]
MQEVLGARKSTSEKAYLINVSVRLFFARCHQPQDEHGFRVGPDRFDGGVQLGQSTPPSQRSAVRRTLRQVPIFHFDFFLSETPPQSCRLTKKALVGLRREMGALRKSLKRGVAVHQTQVKEGKEVNIIRKPTLRKCRELAAKAIPDLLTLLENEPTQKTLWRFYEHFAALLACVYGHRGGVLQNITMQEVLGARKSTSEKAYLINVANHKTNMAFGSAPIVLTEEFSWSCRLTKKALVGLRREMGALRKFLKRGVAVHQTQVKKGKEVNIT